MGSGGGGGGPLGVGNSFTGPASALEIVGDHAYAASGMIGASTSSTTALDFTSGNFYMVGRIAFSGYVRPAAPASGDIGAALISFNGIDIAVMKNDGASEQQPTFSWLDIVIPSYTQVKVTVEANTDDADQKASILITGRIYRG